MKPATVRWIGILVLNALFAVTAGFIVWLIFSVGRAIC